MKNALIPSFSISAFSFLVGLALSFSSVHGIILRGENPLIHNRFGVASGNNGGTPSSPSSNPNFYQNSLDFSGVGWVTSIPNLNLTLIGSQYVIGASHTIGSIIDAADAAGESNIINVNFLNRNDQVINYQLSSIKLLTNSSGNSTDLFIGKLNRAITLEDRISHYKVGRINFGSHYAGENLLVYGRGGDVSLTRSRSIDAQDTSIGGVGDSRFLRHAYYFESHGADSEGILQPGDSGSPTFVVRDGKLQVVGTHTSSGTGTDSFGGTVYQTADVAVAHYNDQAEQAMLDSSDFFLVPEPTTLGLIFIGASILFMTRYRSLKT